MQHRAKKRLGQNFLVDQNIIQRIVDSINPGSDDQIIEIGPGLGALTRPVLERVNRLDVIEFDHDIIPKLRLNCSFDENLVIHENDVLKFDFSEFHANRDNHQLLRVIGNLPYNISTPVLFHLLNHRHVIKDMHFMLQKEVVDRITANPGSKSYGRLSVMIQAYFEATALFIVPPESFEPAPKVDSAILRLKPITHTAETTPDYKVLEQLVRTAFSQRRKTLRNTLKKLCTDEQLEQAGIDPSLRPESVTLEQYLELHEILKKNS